MPNSIYGLHLFEEPRTANTCQSTSPENSPGVNVSNRYEIVYFGMIPSPIVVSAVLGRYLQYINAVSWSATLYLHYYRRAVLKKLSSKIDEFLDGRSQFDSDHGVNFYAPTC